MEKHEFVPTDLINWCGFGMKRDENGNMDVSEACCEREDHPIHAAQPKKPAGEPERVSDERLDQLARSKCASLHRVGDTCIYCDVIDMARELRTLRTQLADRDNHIKYAYAALGDANRSIYLFDHIRKLKEQLAEKDAAIKKARRDALEISRKAADEICGCFNIETPRGVRYAQGIKGTIAIIIEQRIRALAAQKKEG